MKVLLDEMIPIDLRLALTDHEVYTVKYMGRNGRKNGELLRLATENGLKAMITNDHAMRHQQSPARVGIPILVTHLARPELPRLLDVVPDILRLLAMRPEPGFHHIP